LERVVVVAGGFDYGDETQSLSSTDLLLLNEDGTQKKNGLTALNCLKKLLVQ